MRYGYGYGYPSPAAGVPWSLASAFGSNLALQLRDRADLITLNGSAVAAHADLSQYANNAPQGTASYQPGWAVDTDGKRSVIYDGFNDKLSVAASDSLNASTNKFTLMAWLRSRTNGTTQNILSTWHTAGEYRFHWRCTATNNRMEFYAATTKAAPGANYCYLNDFPPVNTFTHVAIVYDGTLTGNTNRLKLYVNGALTSWTGSSGVIPAEIQASTAAWIIGAETATDTSYGFNGSMDDLSKINLSLTAAEVSSVYSSYRRG